jgi:hypothetical protein
MRRFQIVISGKPGGGRRVVLGRLGAAIATALMAIVAFGVVVLALQAWEIRKTNAFFDQLDCIAGPVSGQLGQLHQCWVRIWQFCGDFFGPSAGLRWPRSTTYGACASAGRAGAVPGLLSRLS